MLELAAAAAKSPSAWDEPGTLGFLVVFGMAVILYFVFRSLAKHLRKINEAARLEAMSPGTAAPGTDAAVTRDTHSGGGAAASDRRADGPPSPVAATDHEGRV